MFPLLTILILVILKTAKLMPNLFQTFSTFCIQILISNDMYETPTRPQTKNVFLYIRQSTDEKAQRQVRSLKDQQRECEILAQRLGLNIVDVFREDRSAKRPHQRPVFKAMLKELSYKSAVKRRADGVLSWHPNRLSRNALEAGMVIQMLDDQLIKDMYFPAYSFHNDASEKDVNGGVKVVHCSGGLLPSRAA